MITMKLDIIAKDAEGKIIKKYCNDGDLFMDNFGYWLAAILKQHATVSGGFAGATEYTSKDTVGASQGLGGSGVSTSTYTFHSPLIAHVNNLVLQNVIGTGTTAASHAQYALSGGILGNEAITVPAIAVGQGASLQQILITFGATHVLASGGTVAESTLNIYAYKNASPPTLIQIQIARDTFTGIVIPVGGSITINYTLQFNA